MTGDPAAGAASVVCRRKKSVHAENNSAVQMQERRADERARRQLQPIVAQNHQRRRTQAPAIQTKNQRVAWAGFSDGEALNGRPWLDFRK